MDMHKTLFEYLNSYDIESLPINQIWDALECCVNDFNRQYRTNYDPAVTVTVFILTNVQQSSRVLH